MIPFVILLFSLLLVFGTGAGGVINFGDSVFPFFPQQSFQRLLYLWDSHNFLGIDISNSTPQIPWYGLAALLDRLGAPLWIINRLWFALPFFLLGSAMYFLSGVVFGKDKRVERLIATLFFMFNPFSLNLVQGSNILTFSFAAGVFVFALFVRGLERPHLKLKDVLLVGISSIFAAANIVVFVMVLLLCAAYLLFFVLINRRRRERLRYAFIFSLFSALYSLLSNLWWLLPFSYKALKPGYFQSLFAAGTDVGTLEFAAQFTSLFDVSRLFYGYQPTSFFPISNYYHYLLAPTMMMVLVVLVFLTALFRRKSKFEIFFLLLAVVSVILASGTRPPFGFVYQFLWNHIPYFHIFRTTNRFNLLTMISYAILLGFFYQRIKSLALVRKSEALVLFFILVSILTSAWPLLSGDVYGQLKPHQIPKDYYQLREFLRNQEGDFRVMSLPMISWLASYSWSAPFDMQEILLDFSPKDTIVNMPGYYPDLLEVELTPSEPLYSLAYYYLSLRPGKLAALSIEGKEKPTAADVLFYKELAEERALEALRLLGARYLIVHRDYVVIYHGFPRVDISALEKNIKGNEGLTLVKSFGDLDVYEVEGFYPRLYAFPKDSPSVEVLLAGFKKISPVEYRIEISDAREPFDLVFAENFNKGWRLSPEALAKGFGPPQRDLGRGFGNVWQINKMGDYELRLFYWPQKLLQTGLAISVLSLLAGVSIIVRESWR